MSTAVDTATSPPRRRHHTRWIAAGVVVLTAVLVAVVLRGIGAGGTAEPPTLQNQLADRVAAILEQSTTAEHHAHGHGEVAEAAKVLCEAKTLGFDPPSATTLAEVKTFYGYHLCAVAEKDRPWDFAVKLNGPLSVQFTQPPVIKVAEGGEGYPERVREIIPPQYQEQAFNALIDPEDMRDLRSRFEDAA
jgi:hypothetical protein